MQKTTHQFAILACRFYPEFTNKLVQGAIDTLSQAKIDTDNVSITYVPGAWELPLAAQKLATTNVQAIIVLGVVIRGETAHFDYVCSGATSGLQHVSLASNCPISLGLITANTREQAINRISGKKGNQGSHAAAAALEMISLLNNL